eukprot:m.86676 g.86676  ORF g.86676 m.86676 type:complete len:457 (-) comp25988_c0_seq1:87-1457(-)
MSDKKNFKKLLKAVKSGDYDECTELLQTININSDPTTKNILVLAVTEGDVQIVEALLQANADIESCGKRGKTLLRIAYEEDHLEVFQFLCNKNALIDDNFGTATLLCEAIVDDNTEYIEAILKRGPKHFDVNKAGKDGFTPLHQALERSDSALAHQLLKKPFQANQAIATSKLQLYPCHIAAKSGFQDVLKVMEKANLEFTSKTGATALMCAVDSSSVRCVEFLLQSGVGNVNGCNTDDNSALHLACEAGDNEILDALIKAGADVNAINKKGYTPLDLVIGLAEVQEHDSQPLIDTLKAAGAKEEKTFDLEAFVAEDDGPSDGAKVVEKEHVVEEDAATTKSKMKAAIHKANEEEPQGRSWGAILIIGVLILSALIPLLSPIMLLFEEEANLFVELDTDRSGSISKKEVLVWFKAKNPDKKKLPAGFFESRDPNEDGKISWAEFEGPKGAAPPIYE